MNPFSKWGSVLGLVICIAAASSAFAVNQSHAEGPVFGDEVEITGSAPVEEQVTALLVGTAARRLSMPESDVRIRLISPSAWNGDLREGYRVSLKEASQGSMPGRVSFFMQIQRENRSPTSHWVSADIEVVRPVVVAKRPLSSFQVVTADDVELVPHHLVRKGERYAFSVDEVVGKRTRRATSQGVPVLLSALDDVPVIRAGDHVTLILEADEMQITTTGEAKENGYLGRRVAVINLESKKVVYGKVRDASSVVVGAR